MERLRSVLDARELVLKEERDALNATPWKTVVAVAFLFALCSFVFYWIMVSVGVWEVPPPPGEW